MISTMGLAWVGCGSDQSQGNEPRLRPSPLTAFSARDGEGLRSSNAFAEISTSQNSNLPSRNACCSGCGRSGVPKPSTFLTALPATVAKGRERDLPGRHRQEPCSSRVARARRRTVFRAPLTFAPCLQHPADDYCAKGGNLGADDLWENRPGGFQSRASSLRRITMPAFAPTISTIPSSRARSAITYRQTPSACSTRAQVDRKSSSPATASSTRRA